MSNDNQAKVSKVEVNTDEVLGPARLSKFGPDAIDRAINSALVASIPEGERTAVLDIKVKHEGKNVLATGVVAANLGDGWGVAAGGAIDLQDRDDWELELVVRKSW